MKGANGQFMAIYSDKWT